MTQFKVGDRVSIKHKGKLMHAGIVTRVRLLIGCEEIFLVFPDKSSGWYSAEGFYLSE